MSLIVFSASRRCASASILRQSAPRVRAGAGADIPTELQLRATRSYSSQEHSSAISPSLTLYQYAICPFCHKTKAVLAYAGVDHKVVEVNPLTKAELKPWSGDYRKVPIAILNDKQLNGSDTIIGSVLENPHVVSNLKLKWTNDGNNNSDKANNMSMEEFQSSENAQKWIKYANDDLAALLYPNICRSLSDSFLAFSYVKHVDTFTPLQKVVIRGVGSVAMKFAASKIKAKRGITDEREALHQALTVWEEEALLHGKHKFASGTEQPNLGDIAVFGTLKSVEGLPAHTEAVEQRGGILQSWYDRMNQQVYGSTVL